MEILTKVRDFLRACPIEHYYDTLHKGTFLVLSAQEKMLQMPAEKRTPIQRAIRNAAADFFDRTEPFAAKEQEEQIKELKLKLARLQGKLNEIEGIKVSEPPEMTDEAWDALRKRLRAQLDAAKKA